MKVLVVDDNTTNRKLLRAILAADGHSVVDAEDGLAALEILGREKIDAIISDILMPRMDGYRLCYEVRRQPRFASLPFIFYTSTYTSTGDESLAISLGADRFICKSASAQMLSKAVWDLMAAPIRPPSPTLQG